ncbi:MAG: PVC-type heme-binding CxxCH protein [Bacteroidota bacterium]
MNRQLYRLVYLLLLALIFASCRSSQPTGEKISSFSIYENESGNSYLIRTEESKAALLVHEMKEESRPYLHSLQFPGSQKFLAENEGLFWAFSNLNGRNYLEQNGPGYWKKVSSEILEKEGEQVKWQLIYQYLNEAGEGIMEESQIWTMSALGEKISLDLEWEGKALTDVEIGSSSDNGLFFSHIVGEKQIVNAARQRNAQANGKRAMWIDLSLDNSESPFHVALFDHPSNADFPQAWTVSQGGLGSGSMSQKGRALQKGESVLYQHELLFYKGRLDDITMTDDWNSFIGEEGMYTGVALWKLAQEEGRNAKFLTPQEAVDNMTIRDGFGVNVWASEPMITQPMAFCWDDKGRLWIAENRDYENRKEGFSNFGNSRILILEDTDKDGVADVKKVFLEGIPFPSAIAVGFDGLFLGAPPNFMFIPDADQDDKADEDDIKILRTGWGIRDRHETLNSLHWGPDGWIYGLEGFATPSRIRKPEGDGKIYKHKDPFPDDIFDKEGVDINGGVWRYHPTKDIFEVVSHGFSNPWGIDYDAKGQLFITACVIPHLFHVIPGGIYHRQGGRHFNPYVYQDIKTIVDHRHRSAHGGARVYQSDAFPEEQKGRIFMANIHEHAVLSDIFHRNGSGFIASDGEDFMMANNAQWIGFSLEIGPDGNLYVLDWHDADICGNSVQQKETGRIFRIFPEESQAKNWEGRYADLSTLNDEQLVDLQLSESDWHTRRARVILQYRGSKEGISKKAKEKLQDMLWNNLNGDYRLKALWTLHVSQAFRDNDLAKALEDKDEYIRAWAIQFLTEDKQIEEEMSKKLIDMAAKDPSAVVRLYLASAMQRVDTETAWRLATNLLSRDLDNADHNIPLMTWFGLEPLVNDNFARSMSLALNSKNPMISQFISRRLVDGDHQDKLIVSLHANSSNTEAILTGMQKALEGRSDVKEPNPWAATRDRLRINPAYKDLVQDISRLFGSAEAAKAYMNVLTDQTASTEDRQKALRGLASQKWAELPEVLPELMKEQQMRIEAIRALAQYEDYNLGLELITEYPAFSTEEKSEIVQTMATRRMYANMLTEAIKKEHVPRKDIPAYVARQLRRVMGNGFVEVWGPIDQLAENTQSEIARYTSMLSEDVLSAASASNGKAHFTNNCGACHILDGEGGKIGPDLTGANRGSIDYLLYNILDPNGDIQDDYKMEVVTTRDGRTYLGNIAKENDRQLVMRIVGQEELIVNKADIQSRESSEVSMMPQGLFQTLSDEEVADLIKYLMVAGNAEAVLSD